MGMESLDCLFPSSLAAHWCSEPKRLWGNLCLLPLLESTSPLRVMPIFSSSLELVYAELLLRKNFPIRVYESNYKV